MPGCLHPLVPLEDHSVPDAERLRSDPDLVAELAGGVAPGPDHLVEGGDIGPPDGQDGGRLPAGGRVSVNRPPVLDDPLADIVDGAGNGHPPVLGVGGDGRGDVAIPQGDQGVSFPMLVSAGLTAVGGQSYHLVAQLR